MTRFSNLRAVGTTLLLSIALPALAPGQSSDSERAEAMGDSLMEAFRTKAAIRAYRQGLEADPRKPSLLWKTSLALSNRAVATSGFGGDEALLAEALRLAQRAVQAAPRSARTHAVLAVALGRYGRALGHLYRIEKAGTVVELGRRAHRHATVALGLDPDEYIAHAFLGVYHRRLATLNPIVRTIGETFLGGWPEVSLAESARHLERAAALAPDEVTAHYELGRTYRELGRTRAARRELREAIGLEPKDELDRVEQALAREILREMG